MLKKSRISPKSSQTEVIHDIVLIMILVRFQELFNILFDEKVDCKLVKSALVEDRMLNWNRINGNFSLFLLRFIYYFFNKDND